VKKGLGTGVDNKEAGGRRGKAGRGRGFSCSGSGPANNRLAPKAGRPKVQPKATRALPSRPGRNVHPAGQPKIRRTPRSKEQIEAEREAGLKALKEKIQAVQMAKEHLAQMNIMEDCEEDDSPVLHPQLSSHSSTMSHKRCHLEVETDSDECFDLREVVHGSDTDSSSESDKAAKTKAKVGVQVSRSVSDHY
jgi:hypothetical protein